MERRVGFALFAWVIFLGAISVRANAATSSVGLSQVSLTKCIVARTSADQVIADQFYPLAMAGSGPIDKKKWFSGDAVICPERPLCMRTIRKSKSFRITNGSVKNSGFIESGGLYDVVGALKLRRATLVALRITSDQNLLMQDTSGELLDSSCDQVRAGERAASRPIVSFGFNFGMSMNRSSVGFENVLTAIPNRNDVGGLRTPLLTEQEKGSGLFLEGCGRYRIGSHFGLQGCGFYEQYSVRSKGKSNPSVGVGISYDSLADVDRIDRVQMFGFSAAAFYEQRLAERHALVLGVGPRYGFVLSKRSSFEYFTGNVFKATRGEVATGPEGIIGTIPVFLEYDYRPDFVGALRVGASMDMDGAAMMYLGFEL